MADNELSCDGTFDVKDLLNNLYVLPMCAAGTLAVDTTALTMCAELTMPLPLLLLVCIGRSLPTYPT